MRSAADSGWRRRRPATAKPHWRCRIRERASAEQLTPNLFRHEVKTTTIGTAGETGTGLGLPLCHDIMIALGGSISAESTPGAGSIFYVELPDVRPRILLVDHAGAERAEIKRHLQDMKLEVSEAETEKIAVASLRESRPNLIIANIKKPELNGLELLNYVKNDPKTKSIPVIIMTGNSEAETRDNAFRMGADDFLSMPIVLEEFYPRVWRFL